MRNGKGFSLIELLIVLGIFAIVIAGLYAAFSVQLRTGVRQYRLAESEMELQIAKTVIERDLAMSGYGLAEDYSGATGFTLPRGASSSLADTASPDTGPDDLILMGTALGMESRASQGWSYLKEVDGGGVPTFDTWSDAREDIRVDPLASTADDVVILLQPHTRKIVTSGASGTNADWLFRYKGANAKLQDFGGSAYDLTNDDVGTLLYGLFIFGETDATQPYYAVRYSLGGTAPNTCASGTQNLLRAESRTDAAGGTGSPLLNCVIDFQVAFGIDTDDNGSLDCWDNSGDTVADTYTLEDLNKRVKQLRAFALVQEGNRDAEYLYRNPDPLYAGTPDRIWVGDSLLNRCTTTGSTAGGVGREVTLTSEQRRFRWRVVTWSVAPRNIR